MNVINNKNFTQFLQPIYSLYNSINKKLNKEYDNKKLLNLFEDYPFLFSDDYDEILLTQETTKNLYDKYKDINISKVDTFIVYRAYMESLVYAKKMQEQKKGDCVSQYNHNFLAYELLKDLHPLNYYKAAVLAIKHENKDILHRLLKEGKFKDGLVKASQSESIYAVYAMIGQEIIQTYDAKMLDWYLNLKDIKLYLNHEVSDNKVYGSYLYKTCINVLTNPQVKECLKVLIKNNIKTYGVLDYIETLPEEKKQKEIVKKVATLALPEKLNKDLKNDEKVIKPKFKI